MPQNHSRSHDGRWNLPKIPFNLTVNSINGSTELSKYIIKMFYRTAIFYFSYINLDTITLQSEKLLGYNNYCLHF